MGVNKVVFGAVAIMDISDSTVTADTLAEGATAYAADGEKITGKMKAASDPVLQEKTATPKTTAQTVTPDSGYDGLSKVTVNAMPTATQATPSITVSSGGLITAKATQTAGYVASGTKQATKQLTVQAAKTVTPTTSNQTAVASGRYTTGAITVKGDANLKAANIAKGVTIFGVTGTHEGGEDLSAELTAQANLISQQQTLIANLEAALENKAGGSGGGGGVPTCTVTFNSFAANLDYAEYTTYENGVYTHHIGAFDQEVASVTLANVVRGSLVTVGSSYNYCCFDTESDNYAYFESGYTQCNIVPIVAEVTVVVIDDD